MKLNEFRMPKITIFKYCTYAKQLVISAIIALTYFLIIFSIYFDKEEMWRDNLVTGIVSLR